MALTNQADTRSAPPASASSQAAGFIALGLFMLVFFFAWPQNIGILPGMALAMLCIALPIALYDFLVLKVHQRDSAGLSRDAKNPPDPMRFLTKWLGLQAVFCVIAFYYWVFPIYRKEFYDPYFSVLLSYWWVLALVSLPYVWQVDRLMRAPEDGYFEAGRLVLGKFAGRNWPMLRELALGWLVKAFFLPLMFCYLADSLQDLIRQRDAFNHGMWDIYHFVYDFSYLIDLLFVTIGYMYTLRLADTHIRTSEPSFFGWTVAIICYQPFWGFISHNYIQYSGNHWDEWLAGVPWALVLWGGMILALTVVYAWASLCFGLRFSNLTYRGLISSGPYRWTKHPAYLSKNISWWMIAVPFLLKGDLADTLLLSLGLVFNNLIYVWRAKTEEAHLMRYPEYREYAAWMQENGIITRALYRIKQRLMGSAWISGLHSRG